jgi:hypothetical protein
MSSSKQIKQVHVFSCSASIPEGFSGKAPKTTLRQCIVRSVARRVRSKAWICHRRHRNMTSVGNESKGLGTVSCIERHQLEFTRSKWERDKTTRRTNTTQYWVAPATNTIISTSWPMNHLLSTSIFLSDWLIVERSESSGDGGGVGKVATAKHGGRTAGGSSCLRGCAAVTNATRH